LGLIEAFVAARDQCPSGRVRTLATAALQAVERDKDAALHDQAYLLLGATQGWRGDRADQVRISLAAFLEETPKRSGGDTVAPSENRSGGDPEHKTGG
jgi:hypothetical protein